MNKDVLNKARFGVAIAAALLAAPALAHHSAAMFDTTKDVVLQGTVKGVQITNPHSWIQLMVPGADGSATEWSIEMANPGVLIRQGFKRSSIKAGDKLTAKVHPMHDGRPAGLIASLTLATGEVLPHAAVPTS